MNRRPVLITLAIVLALIGAGGVYLYGHNADKRAVAGMRATRVLIVEKEIPVGITWDSVKAGGYVQAEDLPESAAPSTAVSGLDVSIPSGQVTTSSIASGQVLLREMFGKPPVRTGVLAIPGTQQALTIQLTTPADVAGFVQAGSQIAIYHTFKLTGPRASARGPVTGGPDMYATKLLAPRVTVLAVSHTAPSSVAGTSGSSTSLGSNSSQDNLLVTMAVSQQDAERIVLAQTTGQLYLALLSSSSISKEDGGTIGWAFFNPMPIYTR